MILIRDLNCVNNLNYEQECFTHNYLFYRCDGKCNCSKIESISESIKCDEFGLDGVGLEDFQSSFCYTIHTNSNIYRACIVQHESLIIHFIVKSGINSGPLFVLKTEASSESEYSTLYNVNLMKERYFKMIDNLELLS